MKTYSCYFVDRTLRVLIRENISCADDKSAVLAARKMLEKRTCAGIEIWDRGRYVVQLLREPSSDTIHFQAGTAGGNHADL